MSEGIRISALGLTGKGIAGGQGGSPPRNAEGGWDFLTLLGWILSWLRNPSAYSLEDTPFSKDQIPEEKTKTLFPEEKTLSETSQTSTSQDPPSLEEISWPLGNMGLVRNPAFILAFSEDQEVPPEMTNGKSIPLLNENSETLTVEESSMISPPETEPASTEAIFTRKIEIKETPASPIQPMPERVPSSKESPKIRVSFPQGDSSPEIFYFEGNASLEKEDSVFPKDFSLSEADIPHQAQERKPSLFLERPSLNSPDEEKKLQDLNFFPKTTRRSTPKTPISYEKDLPIENSGERKILAEESHPTPIFQGISPSKPTSPDSHLSPDHPIVEELVSPAQMGEIIREFSLELQPSGERKARLKLEPPDLGEVEIDLRVHRGEVKLFLAVEKPETARELHLYLPHLRNALEEAGFRLTDCQIGLLGGQVGGEHLPREESFPQKAYREAQGIKATEKIEETASETPRPRLYEGLLNLVV